MSRLRADHSQTPCNPQLDQRRHTRGHLHSMFRSWLPPRPHRSCSRRTPRYSLPARQLDAMNGRICPLCDGPKTFYSERCGTCRRAGQYSRRTPPTTRLTGKTVERDSGCVEFTGATNGHGYGQLADSDLGRPVKAHRVAWEIVHGPIPQGLFICHHCDNPLCVNVDHLFLGTDQDNVSDMIAKGRHHNQRKTHCPSGHPYSGDNLRMFGEYRTCVACRRLANQKWRAKARA